MLPASIEGRVTGTSVVIGAALDHQWLVLDALNNLLGLSSSDAVKLTIGQ